MVALRLATHDSGPKWFRYSSLIHDSTPVYTPHSVKKRCSQSKVGYFNIRSSKAGL